MLFGLWVNLSLVVEDWPDQLGALLKANGKGLLNTVVDAGGGDIMGKTFPIMKPGGRVVVFGMCVLFFPGPIVLRTPLLRIYSMTNPT